MTAQKWMAPDDTAFVIVDPQKGFCPGGNLAVPDGDKIIPAINRLKKFFKHVFITKDWHPPGHKSFASAHPGKKPFEQTLLKYGMQVLWPDHCVQNTADAEFHPDLEVKASDTVLRKGTNPEIDSYSAFAENDRTTKPRFDDGQTFAEKLRARGIKRLVFSGLAFDYCVGWNALDAIAEGFEVIVVTDATRSISPETEKAMRDKLVAAGAKLVTEAELPAALGVQQARKLDAGSRVPRP